MSLKKLFNEISASTVKYHDGDNNRYVLIVMNALKIAGEKKPLVEGFQKSRQ